MSEARPIAIIAGQLVLGGAERQLYLWLSNLDRDRFRPVVATLHPDHDDYWERPIEALGIDVLRIHRRRSRVRRLAAISSALRGYRPDLIHGWHLFTSPYAGAAARFVGARASLGSLRGSFRTYTRDVLMASLTNLLTDGLVVNSASAAKQIQGKRRLLPQRVFAVPNAVEPVAGERVEMRFRFGERWKIPESRIWLGSIGRFEASKHFDLLLELTASLVGQGEDLHLVLFGYGHEMDGLRTAATALGIGERVTFTGEDAEARFWIKAVDVFCFTSLDEGLPNVVMEAAAAGVPVLAWRTDFLQELLGDGPSAMLVEPLDREALQEGLHLLIQSRERRLRLGEAARSEVLGKFGVSAFVRRLSAVYDELLGTGASRPT
jgi:glycosyltransferase involved in cell wall biosynthesis